MRGWEKLICPFFGGTCRRVLGRYLEENGFTEKGLNVSVVAGATLTGS